MIGITRFGAYIPKYRMERKVMAASCGSQFAPGERSVANYDEDTMTMAVEAALNCTHTMDMKTIDSLYFAASRSPYLEKQSSNMIATALDCSENIFTSDHLSSLRSGTTALKCALDAVGTGSAKNVIVTTADSRIGEPGSDLEQICGDGGSAVLVGQENVIASFDGFYSVSEEFMDVWQMSNEDFLQEGDAAFIQQFGHARIAKRCVEGILEKYGIDKSDIDHFVLSAPDKRKHSALVKSLKLSKDTYIEDPLITTVGYTGAAAPLMLLIATLERAKPGQRILLNSYGSGSSDAFLFTATPALEQMKDQRGISYFLKGAKKSLNNYGKFLKFKKTIPSETIKPFSSWALLWKQIKQNIQLYGTCCNNCGTFAFPMRRVCQQCNTKDDFDYKKLPRTGKIYTLAKDHLYPSPDSPTVMVVVDLYGGGRFYGQLVDCVPSDVEIGMKVEFTFRKFHEGAGFYNYSWKLRPL